VAALLGLGGARASAQSSDPPSLVVQTTSFGRESLAAISIDVQGAASAVDIEVPREYGLQLSQAAGTEVGYVSVFVGDVSNSAAQFASGDLVVDDQNASSTSSATCAPGAHEARWSAELALVGRSPLRLVVYVDTPGSRPDAAATLRVCPIWDASGEATAVYGGFVSLIVENVFVEPASPGVGTWRAFVEPASLAGGTFVPNPAARFEVRSLAAHPHTTTLAARYDPKKKAVLLTGRVMAAGRPEAGASVDMAAYAEGSDGVSFFGPVTTNAAGEFSARRHVTASTTFTASVDPVLRACQESSTAPAGCRSETVSPPGQASASVHVRGAHEGKLAPLARDQALAHRATLRASDLPAGWQGVVTSDPFFPCRGFQPDLSKLTVHGEAASLVFIALDSVGAVWTSSEVYASAGQAKVAFGRSATMGLAHCVADNIDGGGTSVVSVGSLRLPRIGDTTRAFRIALSDSDGTGYGDIVFVRRGRVLIRMGFIAHEDLTALETKLAKAVAARAH
jgi:hypothetical protein